MADSLEEARKRITEFADVGNKELNLSNLGLRELPKRLWELKELRELNLAGNYIGEAGAKDITNNLNRLTKLDLSGNRIGDAGAKSVAGLKELTELFIAGNDISDAGAGEIAKIRKLKTLKIERNNIGDAGAQALARGLTNLETLKIEINCIGDQGAQEIAAHLTKLETLRIGNNYIGDAGAKAIANNLRNLTTLKIGNNHIGDDGAKKILDAFDQRKESVETLTLRRNTNVSFMPKEAIGGSDAKALLAAYRRYKKTSDLEPLKDAKILVVGDAEVGKTSLVNFLVHDKPISRSKAQAEKRTKGIERTPWKPKDTEIDISLWDFAGQEITFGAHQYFLTERSLYIVVLSNKKRHDRSIYRWLPLIEARAGNAPVIVVINQSDNGEQHLILQEDEIKNMHPQIVDIVRTSCEHDPRAHKSINDLRKLIVKTLEKQSTQELNFPSNWLCVKKLLLDKPAENKFVMNYDEFVDECKRERPALFNKTPNPIIDDPHEQRQLLRTLYNLGVVMVPGISRSNLKNPEKLQIVDPNWLAQGIDKILNNQELLARKGILHKRDLAAWLDPQKYPEEHHDIILNLMLDESTGLAAPLDLQDIYLVPQALPAKDINCDDYFSDGCLSFAYLYDPLPDYLLPHFIVKLVAHSLDPEKRTRYGVFLQIGPCHVHVAVNIRRNMLKIRVAGDRKTRHVVLANVRHTLSRLHQRLGLHPTEHVPLPDDPDTLAPYQQLGYLYKLNQDLLASRSRISKHMFWSPNRQEPYDVEKLLEEIRGNRPIELPAAKKSDGSKPKTSPDQHKPKDQRENPTPSGPGTPWIAMATGILVFIGVIAVVGFVLNWIN
ncbi:MAG: COR domain-containing protein [Pseudomonadota bacterium]